MNHFLLVDDEEIFRLSTTALLSKAGYACDCAAGVAEAYTLLE